MLADLGLPPLPAATVREFIGGGIARLVERCLAAAGPALACDRLEPALRAFGAHYAVLNGRSSAPYSGVLEGLERLRAAGVLVACVTNKAAPFTRPLLERSRIAPLLDAVVTSDEVGRRKPDPAPFLEACLRLGVAPADTVVIGDSANDAEGGRAAGCRVVLVTYGYSEGRDVRRLDCDAIAESFPEAVEHVLN